MAVSNLVVLLSIIGFVGGFLLDDHAVSTQPSKPQVYTPFYTSPVTSYIHREYVTELGNYGTFSSPNYPADYPSNTVKVYQLGRIPYVPVRLTFRDFNLEYCTGCTCDNITIAEYGSSSPIVLCGSMLPNKNGVLELKGPVTLTFSSDKSESSRGFQAVYEIGGQTTVTYPPIVTSRALTSLCPVLSCPTCRWYESTRIIYGRPCSTCVCEQSITGSTGYSTYPWATKSSVYPWATSSSTNQWATKGSTYQWATTGSTYPWGTSSSTSPWLTPGSTYPWLTPGSTYPWLTPGSTSPWLTPGSTSPWLTPGSTSPWSATSPAQSSTPQNLLSSLFRIHGELRDLEDKAKQIDDEIINLIQQIEGARMRGRVVEATEGRTNSALMSALQSDNK